MPAHPTHRLWRRSFVTAVIAVGLCVTSARADSGRPSNRSLVYAGLAMAPPTYFTGVILHEGSHALAARLVGGTITDLSLLPGRHPRTKQFFFAYVDARGLYTRAQKTVFLLAPKLTDVILLGGYSLLIAFDHLPENRYGALSLTVLATGLWVDFSRDIIAFWPQNDLVKIYDRNGFRSEWSRIPLRLVHAAISAGAGYMVARGYQKVFADDDDPSAPVMVPLWSGRFE